jgi:hypothetical protein
MIIVLNTLSAVALTFIMVVYTTGWKTISSFPMRLVQITNYYAGILLMRRMSHSEFVCVHDGASKGTQQEWCCQWFY